MRDTRRGLTLIELLCAVALATVIVGIVAASSTQVQSAIGTSQQRLIAAAEVRAAFVDIEMDLARIIPADAPAPFTFVAPAVANPLHPIQIERPTGGILPAQPNDPTPGGYAYTPQKVGVFARYGDKLRVFSTVQAYDNVRLNMRPARALVEYSLDPAAGTAGAPQWYQLPNNGLYVGRLRRRMLQQAWIDTAGLNAVDPNPPILVDRVTSFEMEDVDGKASDLVAAGGRLTQSWLDPDVNSATGAAFMLTGTLVVNARPGPGPYYGPNGTNPPTANTTDETVESSTPADDALLTALPIGADLYLYNSAFNLDAGGNRLPTRYQVRRRTDIILGPPAIVKQVLLSDRVFIEAPAGPGNPRQVQARAFIPPAMIRVCVTVAFGKGPDAGMARFSRVFPVSH